MSMDTYGIIGFTTDNVGIDRRFYTGRTDTDPVLAVSYNDRRVDVYLNGIKLVGDHPGNSDHDYDINSQTGQGTSITIKTGVALVASDVIECIGYVSLAGNTVTTYNPTPASGGGWNVFTGINHVASDLVNVYLNGVLLDATDYTLDASANTLTFLGATLTASDVVMVQVIGALDNANFVPASGGTFTGNIGIGTGSPANSLSIEKDSVASAEIDISLTNGTVNKECILNFGNNLTTSDRYKGRIFYQVDNNVMGFWTDKAERMRLDATGNLKFNSGFGSVGAAYGCRAWVNFNGTTSFSPNPSTSAIRGSGNVSSITDDGGFGKFTINFTTAMPDANYSATAIAQRSDYDNSDFLVAVQGNQAGDWSTTSLSIGTCHASNNTMSDPLSVGIAIFR